MNWFEATMAAKDWLAQHGYDAEFGARPLRRLIQKEIEDQLSDAVLSGESVLVDVEGSGDNNGDAEDRIVLRHRDDSDETEDDEAETEEDLMEEALPAT
jgi:ATP-dependent Clp protease ATP-binding subunit ClpC